jgi:ATP-binding cassette subfamily B protein
MRLIWQRVKKYRKLLFLALVLATINQGFSLLDPQIFRLIIDNYATNPGEHTLKEFFQGVGLLVLAAVGVAFVSRTAKTFQEYYVSVITQRVGTSMYSASVKHTFSLPYGVFEDRRSGEILQKLQKARIDTQAVIEGFIGVIFLTLVGMVIVLGYAFYVHWLIGLVYFLIIPVLGGFTYFISRKIKAAQKSIVLQTAELAGATTETIRNVELVKSLGLESQEIKRLNDVNERILELELEKVKLVRTLGFLQGTAINAFRSALLLLMLVLIAYGAISLGEFFTLLFYSFFIFAPLSNLGTVATQYQEAKASNEALEEILRLPPQKKPKNATIVSKIRTMTFNDVSFKYPTADVPAVKNVSLTIKAGETVAFAGASGSGKTTLAKLLVGLYTPTSGSLRFNDVDAKTIDFDELRGRIGLVSQETQLFAGTIKENLLFVNPSASDKQCMDALRSASVAHIVERGDKGLATKIGEGGIKLSGGERQRLAIARALLRDPEFIIFDEATSSLDSLSEEAITETIHAVKKSRPNLIVVIIAHRLSTIVNADKIYVFEKGAVSESGTHAQLLKKKGLYFAFWRQQTEQPTRKR